MYLAASPPLTCIGGARPAGKPGNVAPTTERGGAPAAGARTGAAMGACIAAGAAGPGSANNAGSMGKGGADGAETRVVAGIEVAAMGLCCRSCCPCNGPKRW